jgi:hypothetical protein
MKKWFTSTDLSAPGTWASADLLLSLLERHMTRSIGFSGGLEPKEQLHVAIK